VTALFGRRERTRPSVPRPARHRLPGRCRTGSADRDTLRAAVLACLVLAGAGAAAETAVAMWSTGAVGRGWAGVGSAPDTGHSQDTGPSADTTRTAGSASGLPAPGSPARLRAEFTGPGTVRADIPVHWGPVRLGPGSPGGCDPANAAVDTSGARVDASGPGRTVEADLVLTASAAPACRGARLLVEVVLGSGDSAPRVLITVGTSRDLARWRVGTVEPTTVPGPQDLRLRWPAPPDADPAGPVWVEQAPAGGSWTVRSWPVTCIARSCSATVPREDSGARRFRVGYRLGTASRRGGGPVTGSVQGQETSPEAPAQGTPPVTDGPSTQVPEPRDTADGTGGEPPEDGTVPVNGTLPHGTVLPDRPVP